MTYLLLSYSINECVLRAWKHCKLGNKSCIRSDAEVVIVAEVIVVVVAVI